MVNSSVKMRWEGDVACMDEVRDPYIGGRTRVSKRSKSGPKSRWIRENFTKSE
jgi:hypothetical protein